VVTDVPLAPEDSPRFDVVARCVRAPLWAQIVCALPAGLWIVQSLVRGAWLRAPLWESLIRAVAAAATPPLAGALLRLLYGGRAALIATRDGPLLIRLGRRPIRAVQIAQGNAALDAGSRGAFVVAPEPGWLHDTGSPPWRSAARARWVVSGAATAAFAFFTLFQFALPLLGTAGAALQFATMPLAAVLVPAVLVVNLLGLWPVSRPAPADRSVAATGVARPA
jgi:hypothetical protein